MKTTLAFSILAALLCSLSPARAASRSDYVDEVTSCEAVLQDIMADPATAIPAAVLQKARGIVIVNQMHAGFLIGVRDGYAVIMVRRPDNTWSLPVLLAAGGGSLGLQAGAATVETVYILTNDDTPKLLFKDRINVGADAKAVAGPHLRELEKDNLDFLTHPVLIYTRHQGLYAGLTFRAGYLARNDDANRILYQTSYTLPELLYSNWVTPPPEVQPLMNYVNSLTR